MTRSVFTDRYERFRQRMVAARKSKGLTQAQLAAQLGRQQSYVSKYERGERRLDVIEFLEVAQALAIDPAKTLRELGHRAKKR